MHEDQPPIYVQFVALYSADNLYLSLSFTLVVDTHDASNGKCTWPFLPQNNTFPI